MNMFTKQIFSKMIEADFNDMTSFNYRDVVMKTTFLISKNEIRQIIKKCKFDSVSNSNEILNRILKTLIKKIVFTFDKFVSSMRRARLSFVMFSRN
jgi:hypothetical protein